MRSTKQLSYFFLAIQLLIIIVLSCNDSAEKPQVPIMKTETKSNSESVNPYTTSDQSPMDLSYYPHDYPILKMNGADTSQLIARVIYSRPQKKGRLIFGDSPKSLREYGKEWRLGANEATEIEFFRDIKINDKKINKGRYIIYAIPYPDKWTIILNTNLFTWGLHMDRTRDIFKVDIPVTQQSPALEDFTMIFSPAIDGTDLVIAWDSVKVILPIKIIPKD